MPSAANAPVYMLYGENQWPTPDMVHCESIAARSRLHDWKIRQHRHHGLMQWLYLHTGKAQASLDGQYRLVAPGSVIVVPQMSVHGFQFAPDARGYVVTLGHPLLERLRKHLAGTALTGIVPTGTEASTVRNAVHDALVHDIVHVPGQPRVLPVPKAERGVLNTLFACLHDEYQSTRAHRNSLMDAMLTCMMVWISRQLSAEAAHAPERQKTGQITGQTVGQARCPPRPGARHFERFGQLLETHYRQFWSVAQYAGQIGVTPAHLNVLCRESVGQSALSLIHQRRLLEAKRMLVYTSMPISAIADALNFNEATYFTRFFQRLTGQSPRTFRLKAVDLLKP